MASQITLNMSITILLDEMVNVLLYKTVEKNGIKTAEKRELPFKLDFALTRNKAILDRYVDQFKNKKDFLLAKYGDEASDGYITISSKENELKYKEELCKFLDTEVTISVIKLLPEDLMTIIDHLDFSEEAIKVLTGYLVDDTAYLNDFKAAVNLNIYANEAEEPKVEEKPIIEEKQSEVKEEVPVTAEPEAKKVVKEAPKAEEKPVKKAITKKKTATTAKKSTAKKTTTKKSAK